MLYACAYLYIYMYVHAYMYLYLMGCVYGVCGGGRPLSRPHPKARCPASH